MAQTKDIEKVVELAEKVVEKPPVPSPDMQIQAEAQRKLMEVGKLSMRARTLRKELEEVDVAISLLDAELRGLGIASHIVAPPTSPNG